MVTIKREKNCSKNGVKTFRSCFKSKNQLHFWSTGPSGTWLDLWPRPRQCAVAFNVGGFQINVAGPTHLAANHSKREHVHFLVVRKSADHLRRHPVRISDDRFALVTTEHAPLRSRRRRRAVHREHRPAVSNGDRSSQAEVRHNHSLILAAAHIASIQQL